MKKLKRIWSGREGLVETVVPLSAISFYSALLHKKDAAAIGAMMEAVVARGNFINF